MVEETHKKGKIVPKAEQAGARFEGDYLQGKMRGGGRAIESKREKETILDTHGKRVIGSVRGREREGRRSP